MYYTSSGTTLAVSSTLNPECFITTGKQRKKVKDYTVYLEEGEEFEIELFNPRPKSILAMIEINGSPISGAGIVIKPGQRVFLERWIETSKKFKFSTYLIDTSNGDVLKAIQNNGRVGVTFYDEDSKIYFNGGTAGIPLYTQWTTTGVTNTYVNGNTSLGFGKLQPHSTYTAGMGIEASKKPEKEIETGRIEHGGSSGQKFETSNQEFNSYSFHTVQYQLLPKSRRPLEVQDLKRYCVECGARIKKNTFKFCPHCGTRLE